jgi:hypothetical protein
LIGRRRALARPGAAAHVRPLARPHAAWTQKR